MAQWYLKGGDGVSGPFSLEELRFLAARSKIGGEHTVAQAADGPWLPASGVPGLTSAAAPASQPRAAVVSCASAPVELAQTGAKPSRAFTRPPPPQAPLPLPPPINHSQRQRTWAAAVIAAGLLLLLLLMLFVGLRAGGGGATGGYGTAAVDGRDVSGGGEVGSGGTGTPAQAAAGSKSGVEQGPQPQTPSSAPRDAPEGADNGTEAPANESNAKPADAAVSAAPATDGGNTSGEQNPPPVPPRAAVIMPLDDDEDGLVEEGEGRAAATGGSAEFFQIRGKGQRFVYVVDCSGSMAGAPFAKACHELQDSIHKLRSAQSFYVIFFDDGEYPQFYPKAGKALVRANAVNKRRVGAWIEGFVQPGGGTEPQGALLRALSLRPDVIYFLTDGQFDPGVAELVRQRNQETTIHTVAFMDQIAEPLLEQIARENRGTYRFVP